MCSIAEYFYELCRILTSQLDPWGSSKYAKILSDTTKQNFYLKIYHPIRQTVISVRANFADISGVHLSCDICTRFALHWYSTKHSWIINPSMLTQTLVCSLILLYFKFLCFLCITTIALFTISLHFTN